MKTTQLKENIRDPKIYSNRGTSATIYKFSKNRLIKVLYHEKYSNEDLEYEFQIGKLVHESGIASPEVFGIEEILIGEELKAGIVMELIYGKTGLEIKYGRRFFHVLSLVKREAKKARSLGFTPIDYSWDGNYILTPERKIKLIDFFHWNHPDITRPN